MGVDRQLIVQNHIQQGSVDPDATVILDKAEFAEPVHEKAHSRPCRSNHFRECLLRDLGNQGVRLG